MAGRHAATIDAGLRLAEMLPVPAACSERAALIEAVKVKLESWGNTEAPTHEFRRRLGVLGSDSRPYGEDPRGEF